MGELHIAGPSSVPSRLRYRRKKCCLQINPLKVRSSCLVQALQNKQTKQAIKTRILCKHSSVVTVRLCFLSTLGRSLFHPSSDLDAVFFPTEFKGKVHSWPRLQSALSRIDLPKGKIRSLLLRLSSQRKTQGQLIRSSVTEQAETLPWALCAGAWGALRDPWHRARCHPYT